MTVTQVVRGDLVFDVTASGPTDGEPILLLHGFPQHASSWDALVPLLTEQGYRTLAMNQRGYSAGANPHGRGAYRITELVADAVAVIDELAGGKAHVVGHDWGSAVAWGIGMTHPAKVRTLTALSVPHTGAFLTSMLRSRQILKSWYMGMFQIPWLPERLLNATYVRSMVGSGQSLERARRDAAEFAGPESFTGPLNWYRALPLSDPRTSRTPVNLPTLFIWGDGDDFVTRAAAERCARYVSGPFRFETLRGASHWLADEAPAEVAALLLAHLRALS
ncbi:MAG TPA: alpha/beta fold hydrolase [Pseudonocardia sp.]|jgi:pimeloyl-ACP methyl ester carboxylesterase